MNLVDEIQKATERLQWDPEGMVSAAAIREKVIPLLLEAADALQGRGGRWLTLTEVRRETGRSGNFFTETVEKVGGRSRLDDWKKRGLADQTEEGTWLINPVALSEASGLDPATDPRSDVERVADRLTNAA